MPTALTTINLAKEQAATYQPLLLADFQFSDGSTLHLCTHPLNAAEGGFAFAGVSYAARLSAHDISEIQSLSQQGISLIPQVSLTIEDPDAEIYAANETTIGFRGAVLTLTLIFWDAGANTFSSDARYIFGGICEKATINATVTTVKASSEVGKKTLPSVVLQRTCPWNNPATMAQRATADNPDSIYYNCGETRGLDVAPPCQHTTATCTRPLRRANITWDPINQQFAKSYLDGKNSLIINTLSGGVIGQPIPMLYGTGWIQAKPIATIGDGNYTRFETAVALGPVSSITKFIVAGEELSPANALDGTPWAYANKDFRYATVNNGRRDGSPNLDVPWNGDGDPYGSIAAFEAVVPKDVAAANSAPSCQILARGGSVRKFQAIASITVAANVATVTLVGANTDIASNGVFPFSISGNALAGINASFSSLTNWTGGPPGTIQFPCPGVANGTGAGGYIRYSQYTENPVWIYLDLRVKGGDDYAQYNMALACAAALVCDQNVTIQGSGAIAWLAKNPGDTTISLLSSDGFPASGKVQIDAEVIAYTGIDSHYDGTHYIPRLTGCSHSSGTTATHAIGATVKDVISAVSRARYSTNLVIAEKRSVADILRGIQAACNLIVNRNTSTGLYEMYIEDTLPDSQPAAIAGSNYNTPVNGFDRNGNLAPGYAAYRFDELTDILAGSSGGSTLEEQARGVNDFPNRLTFNFADSAYTYAQSSISVDDIDDVYRVGQEIPGSPSTMPEGITSYDQALCQARLILAKSLHGNEAGDGRGTRTFTFTTTFKALHLRVGHLVLLNSIRLGITDQTFRVTAIQPTMNWEDARISIAWHDDKWYALGFGRKVPQDSSNRRLTQATKTPLQWTANQDAVSADAVLPSTYKTFGLSTAYSTNADGSQSVRISATGEQIINQFSPVAQAPLLSLAPLLNVGGGGHIVGGQSYYLAVAAKDAAGLLSPISQLVRVDLPAGSTNWVSLPVTSWPGTAAGYVLYAGQTAQRLTFLYEAAGTPASVTFADVIPYGESAPDGSFDHLEADAFFCLSNGVAVAQTIATATTSTVTFRGAAWAVNAFAGRIASVVASDADTRVRNFLIASNTANTLTFAGTPNILVDDWVCVRSKITVAGLTVTDALWTFVPGALIGKVLRTIAGGGTPQSQLITANTATSITVAAAWTYPIDATTIVIVEELAALTTVRTSRLSTNLRHAQTAIGIDTKNYAGRFVRVTCYAADGRNTRAAEALALTRDLYIAGAAGAIVPAGMPAAVTSFGMSYEIEGTAAQGGGKWTWTGSAWFRTNDSDHAIGDAHAGTQGFQATWLVGVPVDPNTQGVWIMHAVYPSSAFFAPFISTEDGWLANGWGIAAAPPSPQGGIITVTSKWWTLGTWANTGGFSYQAWTAWTYNRNASPDYNQPADGSPLIIKVAWPAGFTGNAVPLALPVYFAALEELEGAGGGMPAVGSASPGIKSVRYKFRVVIPPEPDGWRMDIMHAFYTDSGYGTIITDNAGGGWGPDGWGRMVDGIPPRSLVGTCNCSGTTLTWVSGDKFTADLNGKEILVGGLASAVYCIDATHLMLSLTLGTVTGGAFAMLWSPHTAWYACPTSKSTYAPWYQGFRPRVIGSDGTVLDPAGSALHWNITTAIVAGIDGTAIAPNTIDLTQVDFGNVDAVLGVFAGLFGIAPGSIDSSKINYIDFAKISNVIITNAMIQTLDVGKLRGTSASFTSLSLAASSGAGVALGPGGASLDYGGSSCVVDSRSARLFAGLASVECSSAGVDLTGVTKINNVLAATLSDIANLQSQITALKAVFNAHKHNETGTITAGPNSSM